MFKTVLILFYLSSFTEFIKARNIETVCGVMNWDPENENGVATEKQYYPWSVAIHQKMGGNLTFTCFGNLVGESTVLTVAHCISDISTGVAYQAENYAVAVGKKQIEEEQLGQTISVKNIYIAKGYKGYMQNFQSDLAVLKLEKAVPISAFVRPVCLDLNNKIQFNPGQKGYLQGFVKPDLHSRSNVRENIEVKYVSHEDCSAEAPKEFLTYLVSDKICARYLKESAVQSCHLLSGVGFVIKEESTGLYYLKAIVSNGPLTPDRSHCISSIASYTNIKKHADFLKSLL